jgi:hypothetical protein
MDAGEDQALGGMIGPHTRVYGQVMAHRTSEQAFDAAWGLSPLKNIFSERWRMLQTALTLQAYKYGASNLP